MSKVMQLDVADGIGILRFINGKQRNPYSFDFIDGLINCLDEAEKRDDVRAVVMTGGEHFCSGGDLVGFQGEVAKGARASHVLLDRANAGARAVYGFSKPIVAAVEGVAFGAGMSLALCADYIVCSRDSRFCQVFARIGACPDTGSSWLLQKRVGTALAKMLVFTGREISGEEAVELGIADQLAEPSETENSARLLAGEIAANPLFAVMTAKRVMNEAVTTGFNEALEIEGRAQNVLMCADDFTEAMKAFSEKRKPVFKDR